MKSAWRLYVGKTTLTAHLEDLRWYVSSIEESEDLSELEDLANLMTYCSTAQSAGHLDVARDEVGSWVDQAITYTMERLQSQKWHEAQARLLQIRGQLSLAQFFFGIPLAESEHLTWWKKMLVEAERAPLFPLERFADLLTIFAPFEGEDPRYKEITAKTDELLDKRTGGFVAASKCRDRAMAMFNVENYTGAVSQLHRAKFKWFTAETLGGSLLAMELLGECYQRLGLVYAAKYYWSGLVGIALHHDREELAHTIVRCLARLANACYYAGEWLDFLNVAGITFSAEGAYLGEGERDEEVNAAYQHLVFARALTHQFSPENDESVSSLIATAVGGTENYKALLPSAEEDRAAIAASDPSENWEAVQHQFLGRPFCDAGESRDITWHALGIGWTIQIRNDFHHTSCGETLSSLLQIAIADLASVDLILLPLNVKVVIELTGGSKHQLDRLPDNDLATWKLLIPIKHAEDTINEDGLKGAALDTLFHILYECSTLPSEKLNNAVDKAIEDDLGGKAFFLGSYARTFRSRWGRETFNSPERILMRPLAPDRPFSLKENPQLPWDATDGPGYSRERADDYLQRRYEVPIRSTKRTLPVLLQDENFRAVMCQLRTEGLFDWELLVIVASVMIDERIKQKLSPQADPRQYGELFAMMMHHDEQANEPRVRPSAFTYERCVMQHNINQMSVANTWGLEVRQRTPAMKPLRRLLDVRYHQRSDDIDHESFLTC